MMAQSISPAASSSLSDLSATRVSFTPSGRLSSTFSLAARRIGARLIPVHIRELDAHLVVHPAAHVDRGRMRPFGRADVLALEVLRRS